jgi:hypothetical protein
MELTCSYRVRSDSLPTSVAQHHRSLNLNVGRLQVSSVAFTKNLLADKFSCGRFSVQWLPRKEFFRENNPRKEIFRENIPQKAIFRTMVAAESDFPQKY